MSSAASARQDAPARLDGGRAWLDVALAALSMFTVFATAYSFGTFLTPMAAEFDADRSAVALVFGITAFAYFVLGAVTGPLVQRVGPRRMILFGGTVQVAGILVTARVDELWQAYVSYGVGVGVGVACGYVPMVAVVGGWFDRRRPLAIGIAVSGIGVSSLVGAPVAARLIRIHGWRDAYDVLAIATGVLLLVVAIGIRTPPSFGVARPGVLTAALRTRPFVLSFCATLLVSITLFSVFVNLVPYAEDRGMRKVVAATLLSVLGAASIVGRNALALAAPRLGTGRTYAVALVVMGVSQLLWLGAGSNYWLLAGFALVFGVAYGGFISLAPILLAEIFGPEHLGGLAGANYSAAGLGALFGPTAGAWLVERTGGYDVTIVIGAALGLAAAALVWAMPRGRVQL